MQLTRESLLRVIQLKNILDSLEERELNEVLESLFELYSAPKQKKAAEKPKEVGTEVTLRKGFNSKRKPTRVNRKGRVKAEYELRKKEKLHGLQKTTPQELKNLARNLQAWRKQVEGEGSNLAERYREKLEVHEVLASPGTVLNIIRGKYLEIQKITMRKLEHLTGISTEELLKRHA